jgi:protein-L-isoaspartate(D-aspartate) O-methyltransferase
MEMMTSNTELTNFLVNINILRTESIIHAFLMIDRADFVLDRSAQDIYEDYPLSIGHGQTISQPRTVAMMMEMLEVKEGDKVLDIGSGSGWTTALLSFIVGDKGSVTGVERVSELVKFGNSNLAKYNR